MGVIKASRQSDGTVPASKEDWKMRVSIGANSSAVAMSSLVGIPSGPDALWGFRFFKSLMTPGAVMCIGSMVGVLLSPRSGMLAKFSLVKTDWNW